MSEHRAFIIEAEDFAAGIVVQERGGFRFYAADRRLRPLEGIGLSQYALGRTRGRARANTNARLGAQNRPAATARTRRRCGGPSPTTKLARRAASA